MDSSTSAGFWNIRGASSRSQSSWSSDDTPLFLRPYVQLRGVAAMLTRAQVESLEVEARWQFYGR